MLEDSLQDLAARDITGERALLTRQQRTYDMANPCDIDPPPPHFLLSNRNCRAAGAKHRDPGPRHSRLRPWLRVLRRRNS